MNLPALLVAAITAGGTIMVAWLTVRGTAKTQRAALVSEWEALLKTSGDVQKSLEVQMEMMKSTLARQEAVTAAQGVKIEAQGDEIRQLKSELARVLYESKSKDQTILVALKHIGVLEAHINDRKDPPPPTRPTLLI